MARPDFDQPNDIAVDDSGRLVLAFSSGSGSGLHVVRLDSSGNIDSTFGRGGFVVVGIGVDGGVTRQAAIDGEGRILALVSGSQETAVVRLHPDGDFDDSFGTFGSSHLAGDDPFTALAIGPNDTVLLAGGGVDVFRFARLTESGQLDTSFGQGGIATVPGRQPSDGPSHDVSAQEVAPASGGKIVVVGSRHPNAPVDESFAAVGRVTSAGLPDPAFNPTGTPGFATPTRPSGGGRLGILTGVVPLADGRTVIGGNTPNVINHGGPFVLGGLMNDAGLDPGFGQDGVTFTDMGDEEGGVRASDLLVQPDGKFILTGGAGDKLVPNDSTFGLARYTSDGALDPSYGTGGTVRTPVGVNVRPISAAALTANNRVVVAGYSFGSEGAVLARYLTDGEGSGSGSGGGGGAGGGSGGVAGGVATNARNVYVHKLVVPKSRAKLARLGVKVLASCDEDCRIVLELRVSQAIANAMGLTGTLLARASKPADVGQRLWVRAKPTGAARRALRSYDGEGRLQVDVTGVAH